MSLKLVVDNEQGTGRAVADRTHTIREMTSAENSAIAKIYVQTNCLENEVCKDILNDAIFQVQKILRGVRV